MSESGLLCWNCGKATGVEGRPTRNDSCPHCLADLRFLSGGSDYHADHKKGAKQVRQLGERGLSVPEFEAIFGKA